MASLELKPGLVFRHKINKEVFKIVTVGIEARGKLLDLAPSTTCYLYLSLKDNVMSIRREQDWDRESTSWEEVPHEYKQSGKCFKCGRLTWDKTWSDDATKPCWCCPGCKVWPD